MPAQTTAANPSTSRRGRIAALLATLLIGGALSFTPAGAPSTASAAAAATSEAVSAISMDSGRDATCVIRTDRTLWCWGQMFISDFIFLIDTGTIGESGKNEPQQIGTDLWLNVSVGENNVCGIVIATPTSTSGALYCFGSNTDGQLGLDSAVIHSSSLPVQIGSATDWTSVSVGYNDLCAIRSSSIYCIGNNQNGQFGITSGSTNYDVLTESSFANNAAGTISMGDQHSCFLTRASGGNPGGTAFCAGQNPLGNLGDGTTTNSSDWVPVAGSHKFSSISAGNHLTCGIASSATTPSSDAGKAFCWGRNSSGELGAGVGVEKLEPWLVDATKTFVSLQVGDTHVCGVTTNGELYCWGSNQNGKSGVTDSSVNVTAIHRIGTANNWAEVSTGDSQSCARTTATRTVPSATQCWGMRTALGNGQVSYFNTPTKLPEANWLSISSGSSSRCGIQGASLPGKLVCFGGNWNGEVGNGTTDLQLSPFEVVNAQGWNEVAVGRAHTCAVTGAGALYCWGLNEDGQLGVGDALSYTTPQRVGVANDWSHIAAGDGFTCGVRSGTSVYCWGSNSSGQIGNGDATGAAVNTPYQVFSAADGLTWKKVSIGSAYVCALSTAGSLFCWGENGGLGFGGGALGDGTSDDRNEPVPSVPGLRFTDVSAGFTSTCAIAVGGGTWCWGVNMYGALGNGSALPDVLFGFMGGVNSAYAGGSAVAVATGIWSGCAIRRGGDLYCWGASFVGNIPVGRDASSPTPTKAGSGFVSVEQTNGYYGPGGGCGIKVDATLWCWGYLTMNNFQNGWPEDYSTPQAVKILYRKPVADGGAQFTGRAKKNSVLTADAPSFSGTPIPAVTYQWYRCSKAASAASATVPSTCTKISSATGSTYTLKAAEVNKYVRLLITAKNKGGTVTILTASSAKVAN